MPRPASVAADLSCRLVQLAQGARGLARRWGSPVLVWTGEARQSSGRQWSLQPDGWVWRKPELGVSAWAAGAAWAYPLVGPSRWQDAANAWRRLVPRVLAEGPTRPVAFAGFAFDEGGSPGPWAGFPDGVLVVPRVLRVSVRGAEYVALSCLVTPEGGEEQVDRTIHALASVREVPAGTSGRGEVVRALPDEQDWKTQVLEAEAACRSGELQKVVLARCVEVATSVTPDGVLQVLSERYPTCTVFAVAREGVVFLGATPETLVRVKRGRVWTQALAGTAPRGNDPDEDTVLQRQLASSSKEAREHELVVAHVREALSSVCARVVQGPREVVTLPNVHHLRTRLSGRLAADSTVLEVAGRLHPTPAVAGLPVGRAREWIRTRESVPRGWYAGVVGWVDASGDGELAVAIRCGLLRGGWAWVFSGCGVVAGADPEREYRESQLKLRPVMEAFGVREP